MKSKSSALKPRGGFVACWLIELKDNLNSQTPEYLPHHHTILLYQPTTTHINCCRISKLCGRNEFPLPRLEHSHCAPRPLISDSSGGYRDPVNPGPRCLQSAETMRTAMPSIFCGDAIGRTIGCLDSSCREQVSPNYCYCRCDGQSVAESYLTSCVKARCTAGDPSIDISSAGSIYSDYCTPKGYISIAATTTSTQEIPPATNTP